MFTCMSFGSFAAISLLSTCNHMTQCQACFSLFYTLNACKNVIQVFIYSNQSYVQAS